MKLVMLLSVNFVYVTKLLPPFPSIFKIQPEPHLA